MGAKTSRGLSPDQLKEPLLPSRSQEAFRGPGGTPSSTVSAPASFKAGKPRKTKDFIGAEISSTSSSSRPTFEPDVDPRLLSEEQTTHAISAQVADLLCRYVEEGKRKNQAKEGDEFHEDRFLRRRCSCFPCLPFPRRVPSPSKEAILDFLNKLSDSLYFCKQVVVLCAIYIERLLQRTDTVLTVGNWRSLVTAGMLVASKVWEDIHPWNADFEECLLEVAGIRYRSGALYRLESLFLEKLAWRVFVDGEVYAAYFFSLEEGRHREETLKASNSRPRYRRLQSDCGALSFMPIIEDEPMAESDTDIEKALSSPRYDFPEMSSSRKSSLSEAKHLDGDCVQRSSSLEEIRSCWRLDAGNPLIGSLRHAPRALAPSKHILQTEEKLWAHRLATRTTELFGHRKISSEAHTLSGATGNQLQTELLQYLSKKRGEEIGGKTDISGKKDGELSLSMLEEAAMWTEVK
ncbi:unnamed protein product [Effrenium voratum]|uniref:Cyclin N-terminal domain-containing protein n=1 Tax=Effrenium voratum TaxID=2562239 RepID=A0AA36N858_9DINO|nr:unnamed protein product [Effrenium voratum]